MLSESFSLNVQSAIHSIPYTQRPVDLASEPVARSFGQPVSSRPSAVQASAEARRGQLSCES